VVGQVKDNVGSLEHQAFLPVPVLMLYTAGSVRKQEGGKGEEHEQGQGNVLLPGSHAVLVLINRHMLRKLGAFFWKGGNLEIGVQFKNVTIHTSSTKCS
jgi:hypothetical protein